MSQSDAPVLALDVPSGVDATSGDSTGAHVRAAATMTLALPKTGLDVGAVGDLWVADIGIPHSVLERCRDPTATSGPLRTGLPGAPHVPAAPAQPKRLLKIVNASRKVTRWRGRDH